MAKDKKKKKGSYGKVLGFCIIVGCVAVLFNWLGGAGFGIGGDFGLPFGLGSDGNGSNSSGYAAENDNNLTQDVGTTSSEEPDDDDAAIEPELLIRVVYNRIYHGELEITIEEFTQLLEDINQADLVWELRDEHAIMETYENVRTLMQDNGIVFTETRG